MSSSSNGSSIDPTRLVYQVEALLPDGTVAPLPWGTLRWEVQPTELAARLTLSVPDVDLVDGEATTWLGQYVQPGTPLLVNAGLPGALAEVFRGVVDGVSRGLDQQAPLGVTAYDLLYDLLASEVDAWYPPGTTAATVVQDLAGQWGIPVDPSHSGPGDALSDQPLLYRRKTVADIFTDVLQRAWQVTGQRYLLRATAGTVQVVTPAQNQTVLWLRTNVAAGEGNDAILGGQEQVVRPQVTRVAVYRMPTAQAPAYNPALQPTDSDGGQAYAGPGVLVRTVDGLTAWGVRQKIVYASASQTDEQAVQQALALLADPQQGQPAHQVTAVVPLVPGVQRGDVVRLTAGLTDGYVYVSGLSCDAPARTMTLQLVADAALLWQEDQGADQGQDQDQGTANSEDGSTGPGPGPGPGSGSGSGSGLAVGAPATSTSTSTGTGWDPATPPVPQTTGWTCSAAALAWLLTALGQPTTEQQAVGALGAGINSSVGLTDATGAPLAAVLRARGYQAQTVALTWDGLTQRAGTVPLVMGGVGWDHWTGVVGASGGTVQLANPDASGGAPDNLARLTKAQFDAYGPFYGVLVQLV